jgi:hypothetical protein
MTTTNAELEEFTDESNGCEEPWCDGPTSETLPCFACFDADREYVLTRDENAAVDTGVERE